MQAPKQELFMLNWEISNLTEKLQKFANIYSKIDLSTLDGLGKLLDTVDAFLTKTSFSRRYCPTEDADDDRIFGEYAFHHSINCKQCGRAVKTTRLRLLKHLAKHGPARNNTSQRISVKSDDQDLIAALRDVQLGGVDAADNDTEDIELAHEDLARILEHIHGSDETTELTKPTIDRKSKSKPKKLPKPKEPKRKAHLPVRLRDGVYLEVGSIPDVRVELGEKTRQFVVKILPKTRFMVHFSRCREVQDSLAHRNIVQSLESTFQRFFPEAKVYLFGSRVTGLGNECSDLDIYLDLENNYDGSLRYSKDTLKWFVHLAEQTLEPMEQWSRLDPVTAARTPILRAWNTKYKIDCDISFTHGLSHSNTRLVQYLFALQPTCYYVALYAKEWSHSFNMPGLNTYTIILLTIFYFQKHNLLPSIYSLQKDCETPYHIAHWQANFEKKSLDDLGIPRIPEDEIQNHLIDFFSFYGTQFCFETRVVCPFLGWAPQKEDFDPLDCEVPVEMATLQAFYDQLDFSMAHPVNDLLSYTKPIVVQDPLELNHNVAKGVSATHVDRFRKFCAHTAALLDEVLNETS